MSRVNGDLGSAVNHLFHLPETIEKLMFSSGVEENRETKGFSSIPVDILDTPKEYIFYMDVPGLSKADIQVLTCCFIPTTKKNLISLTCLNQNND